MKKSALSSWNFSVPDIHSIGKNYIYIENWKTNIFNFKQLFLSNGIFLEDKFLWIRRQAI